MLHKNFGLEPIWEGRQFIGAGKPFNLCHSELL